MLAWHYSFFFSFLANGFKVTKRPFTIFKMETKMKSAYFDGHFTTDYLGSFKDFQIKEELVDTNTEVDFHQNIHIENDRCKSEVSGPVPVLAVLPSTEDAPCDICSCADIKTEAVVDFKALKSETLKIEPLNFNHCESSINIKAVLYGSDSLRTTCLTSSQALKTNSSQAPNLVCIESTPSNAVAAETVFPVSHWNRNSPQDSSLVLNSNTQPSFSCPHCNIAFTRLSNLERHVITRHSHSRPTFQCEHCDKVFTRKCYLTTHVRSLHSASKPAFPCPHCDMVLTQKGNLARHVITRHSSSKPAFQCPYCDNMYTQKCNLTIHVKTFHSASPPAFPCPLCDKVFTRRSSLTKHTSTFHSASPPTFPCNHCNKVFTQSSNLTRHINTVHQASRSEI